jgi:hypothetical protein
MDAGKLVAAAEARQDSGSPGLHWLAESAPKARIFIADAADLQTVERVTVGRLRPHTFTLNNLKSGR